MNMKQLNQAMQDGIQEKLRSMEHQLPCHVLRASQIGHPCKRFLYYSIHDWEKAEPMGTTFQGIVKTGQLLEDLLIGLFNRQIGPACTPPMRIVQAQTATRDETLESVGIYGTFDGILQVFEDETWSNKAVIDIKTANPNLFQRYTDIQSLAAHPWSALYPAQVMAYAFSRNLDRGVLAFVNKSNLYDWKFIEVPIDYEYMEGLLTKAKEVKKALTENKEPDKINQYFWCSGCRFQSYCMPEWVPSGPGPQPCDDRHLKELVSRFMTLRPAVKQYNQCEKMLKNSLPKGQDLIFDEYLLQWNEVTVNRPATPAKTLSYWKWKWIATRQEKTEEEPSDELD